ncbi:NACHT and WD repeat domain-containing protein [Cellulomonas wangsupingiae]|uniref:AAA family ATPase n=1 Tax=Cellulomonas wangsupingiae TaxID=2968085 RepID=A0ABY5K939_9CELL|nr:AAA family ATPase [Cellulomonas wangsupingiae]MCC2334772.1 AAA family ATPase [Cellulomonas wangsupingiae]UUI66273.1 AAA family ATPase [Cellulomonas wangsupingiae]
MTTTAPRSETARPSPLANPFVGPQSIPHGAPIYGRTRETTTLLNLLVAERIVLLYSPSGAGKTSLVNAALRPALVEDDFEVLPVASVRHEPGDGDRTGRNRYALSIMSSLEQRLPVDQQLAPADLAALTLHQYLTTRTDLDDQPGNEVLVVDHFEDALRVDPFDLDAKRAFFAELGEALADRRLWALFVMREDYLASLDPYLRLIPLHFQAQFRLDLLRPDSARQAIVRPIEAAGAHIDDDAVTRLLGDLRRVNVLQGDEVRATEGPYVEPVQLQVACHRLWQNLEPGQDRIRVSDVEATGDVDSALRTYYRESVARVSEETGVPERMVREWFEHDLVTPHGLRTQVTTGPGGTDLLNRMIATHLLRAEERHGTIWYELSHDRLVGPVSVDNEQWAGENLSAFERDAQLWDAQHRPDGLLLSDDALAAEERAVDEGRARHNAVEQAFFARSVDARSAREHERRSVRRTRRALVVAVAALVVAVAGGAAAGLLGATAADRNRELAASLIAAEGQRLVQADPEAALMLATESLRGGGGLTPPVRDLIAAAVVAGPVAGQTLGPKGMVTTSLGTSLDGRWTVIGVAPPTETDTSTDGDIQVLVLETATGDTLDGVEVPAVPSSVGVSDDGQVTWVDETGDVWWWDREAGAAPRTVDLAPTGPASTDLYPYSVIPAPDGSSLGITSDEVDDEGVWTQQIARFTPDGTPIGDPYPLAGDGNSTWSWDGDLWVTSAPGGVTLGRFSDSSFAPLPIPPPVADTFTVETSRDGSRVLAFDDTGRVLLWDAATRDLVWDWAASASIATVSADGSLLAVRRQHEGLEVYDVATRALVGGLTLSGRETASSLWFLPDDRLAVTGLSGRATIHDWRSEGRVLQPPVGVAATSDRIAVSRADGTSIWSADGRLTARLPTSKGTSGVAFLDDEVVVVTRDPVGETGAAIEFWSVDDGAGVLQETVDLPGMAGVDAVATTGDGQALAVAYESTVDVVAPQSCTLDAETGDVIALDFTEQGTLVVSRNDGVTEYDVTSPQCLEIAEPASAPDWDIHDTAVDPASGTLAVVDLWGGVRLHVGGFEQEVIAPAPPGATVAETALLPGGDSLVLMYGDGSVSVYDVTRRELSPLRVEPGTVTHLETAQDTLVMAIEGRAAPVTIPLTDESLRELARERPDHALTDVECVHLLGDLCRR